MVSDQLLNFFSDIFASIHNNTLPFGEINVILAGDLTQFPHNQPTHILHNRLAIILPTISKETQRQHANTRLYRMLQKVQTGQISTESWNMLQQRHSEFLIRPSNDILLNTTHIVGFKETAKQINRMICNILPVPNNKFLISQAIDIIDSIQWNTFLSNQSFKSRTNLPPSVRLQPGACIMYLNNSLIEQGICNGTVGIITDVNPTEESV